MQHGQVDGALEVTAEAAVCEQALEHVAAAELLPQPPEHEIGPDADPAQLGQLATVVTRQHDRAPRVACRRGDEAVEQARGLDLVTPAERLDDALDVTAA